MIFLDNFNRPDTAAGGVSNGWTDTHNAWKILGSQLVPITGNFSTDWLYRGASEAVADQRVTIEVADTPASSIIFFRANGPSLNGYGITSGSYELTGYKFIGGSPAVIGSCNHTPIVGTRHIVIEVVGTKLRARVSTTADPNNILNHFKATLDGAYTSGSIALAPLNTDAAARLVSCDEQLGALKTKWVIVDGTSIERGFGNTSPTTQNYAAQLGAALGSEWFYSNFGVVGQTLADMMSDVAVETDPTYDDAFSEFWYLAGTGATNSFYTDASDWNAIYTDYVALCQGRQTAGMKVCATTIMPRDTAGASPGMTTAVANFNAAVRLNKATFSDALADYAADIRLQNINDTIVYLDKIHPTPLGGSYLADIAASAIRPVSTVSINNAARRLHTAFRRFMSRR